VMNRDGSSARAIRLDRPFGGTFAWSPDGRWILCGTMGLPTTAVAVEVSTGKQIPMGISDRALFARWTEDSRAVLVVLGGQNETSQFLSLREVDLAGGSKELLQIPAGPGSYLFPFDRKSAFVRRGADRPMMLESLSGKQSVQILPALPGTSSAPILSASGQWVAFRRNPQGNNNMASSVIDVAKMDGSSHTAMDLAFSVFPGAMAFLPGDKQLIVSGRAPVKPTGATPFGSTYLVTLDTRDVKELFTFRAYPYQFAQVVVSPDGKSMLYTSRDTLPAEYMSLDLSRFVKSKP
jgi:hypothetical protein